MNKLRKNKLRPLTIAILLGIASFSYTEAGLLDWLKGKDETKTEETINDEKAELKARLILFGTIMRAIENYLEALSGLGPKIRNKHTKNAKFYKSLMKGPFNRAKNEWISKYKNDSAD